MNTNGSEDDLDKEIAEMLVDVISRGLNSGAFHTESILEALRANYDVTIKRKS